MIKGCILPWMHIMADVSGDYKICCHVSQSSHTMGSHKDPISSLFNNDKYKEVRKQMLSGQIPNMCKIACYDIEDLGGESNRQQVNKRFKEFTKLQDYTNDDGSVNNNPIYLDVRFGNKCNFKCRICSPYASSAWFKDAKNVSAHKNAKAQLEDYYTDSPEFWEYLNKIKKSVKYFYFAGGEPLLMDGHYKLLQWFIDNNKTDVELTYNTNLSTLNYKNHDVFELWKHFDNISLWPSVDGYKSHCQYSRTNFNWDTFITNLLKVRKYVNTVSCTTSIYSILTTPELIAHMRTLNISTYLSILDTPHHLDMRLLPDNIKNKVNKKFEILKRKFSFNTDQLGNINKTVEFLNKNIENESNLLKRFKTYNSEVDIVNNTSFIKIYPELAEWYEQI